MLYTSENLGKEALLTEVMAQLLMRGESPFTEGERELIAAYVSLLNQSDFCIRVHSEIAQKYGIPAVVFRQLKEENIAKAEVEAKMKPVLEYVHTLNNDMTAVTEHDIEKIRQAGWEENAVTQANLICGFFNMVNRLSEGLNLPYNTTQAESVAIQLFENGYMGALRRVSEATAA